MIRTTSAITTTFFLPKRFANSPDMRGATAQPSKGKLTIRCRNEFDDVDEWNCEVMIVTS